ncbi:MAG: TRAP transporter substrate-binding protein [Clostridiales Family XIII bacterium]|nr:TRAP transporter substrate-binding protein [Clostridiales Family XIII bacterium]
MKKRSMLVMATVLALLMILAACGGSSSPESSDSSGGGSEGGYDGETIELTLSHFNPPTAISAMQLEAWAKRVEDRAEGKIKINIFPGGSLGAPQDHYNMAKEGTVDIAYTFVGINPGVFPISEGFGLPMIGFENAWQSSMAMEDMYLNNEDMQKEYADVKLMYIQSFDPAIVGTNGKKIETMEDLKGLKLRITAGPVNSFFTKLGASPVTAPVTEIYTNLEKKILDGFYADSTSLVDYKLAELSTNILDGKICAGPFIIVMNLDKWNSLPDDLKACFDAENGLVATDNCGKMWDEYTKEVYADLESQGKEINRLSAEERARWEELAAQVAQEWIADMDGKGYDGQALYDEIIAYKDKYVQ